MFRVLSLSGSILCLVLSSQAQIPVDTTRDLHRSTRLSEFWDQGYLFSAFDSVSETGDGFYLGDKYEGRVGGLWAFNEDSGNKESLITSSRSNLSSELVKKLNDYANNGYPFARLVWDSISIERKNFLGYLTLFPGPEIRYDSLQVSGDPNISRNFLARVLDMEFDEVYSEEDFTSVSDRLTTLPFLQLKGKPDVAFEGGRAFIYLPLKTSLQNTFEGVLGVFPGQSPNEGLAVTGFLDLNLVNLFKSGKSLHFAWNRFSSESQSVDLEFNYPFFLSSRLFLRGKFNLLKQDTTFLNQSWELSSGTPISGFSEINFGYSAIRGALIQPTLQNVINDLLDYESKNYFFGVADSRYGRPLSWFNSLRYRTSISLGNKSIIRNPSLAAEVYDTLNLTTVALKLEGQLEYQITLRKGRAFYHELELYGFDNDQILQNELFRLGGLKSVRGFNENFFFAQHYALNRFEWRQYFESKSYLSLFTDQLFSTDGSSFDYAHGYGIGLSLETSNGLFTFAAALGKSKNVSFDPNNVKIHFGYTSIF